MGRVLIERTSRRRRVRGGDGEEPGRWVGCASDRGKKRSLGICARGQWVFRSDRKGENKGEGRGKGVMTDLQGCKSAHFLPCIVVSYFLLVDPLNDLTRPLTASCPSARRSCFQAMSRHPRSNQGESCLVATSYEPLRPMLCVL